MHQRRHTRIEAPAHQRSTGVEAVDELLALKLRITSIARFARARVLRRMFALRSPVCSRFQLLAQALEIRRENGRGEAPGGRVVSKRRKARRVLARQYVKFRN